MPHVEVLPNSAASLAPGWTYVVDTGYDPSKVAINPKNKKRAAAQLHSRVGDSDLSARQQTAIARRIAELERDNDPKQNIPIPSGKATGSAPKTQNARRILQYQRQIKHWLDDEEAQIALAQSQVPGPRSAAATSARRESGLRRMSMLVGRSGSGSGAGTPIDGRSTPGPSTSAIPVPNQTQASPSRPKPPANEYDDDALLSIESSMPAPVSQEELDALLNAPPLSYAASHAKPPEAGGPPQRQFCDNCGYWGTIRCRKCGSRVCGLECRDAHEATRCLKWA